MGIGDIRAAVTVVLSIRDDWAEHRRAVAGQIEALAGDYDHPDVLYVAVVVARNPDNRSPSMLTTLAPKILAKLHAKQASNPTRGTGGRIKNQYACDTCGLTRDLCEQQAGNLDGADHLFKTITQAEAEREKQRYVREFPQGRDFAVGKLPADVANVHIPKDPQEEAAS